MPENLRYKRIFRETFNLLMEFDPPSNTPEYWANLTEKVGTVCAGLGSDPLAVDILAAIYTDLERRVNRGDYQRTA